MKKLIRFALCGLVAAFIAMPFKTVESDDLFLDDTAVQYAPERLQPYRPADIPIVQRDLFVKGNSYDAGNIFYCKGTHSHAIPFVQKGDQKAGIVRAVLVYRIQ